jgi:hypothetical protein
MDVTGPLFLDIINTSLQQGVVPNEWKKSTVVPIQKVSGMHRQTTIFQIPKRQQTY